jgi:cell division protein FtsL
MNIFLKGMIQTMAAIVLAAIIVGTATQIIANTGKIAQLEKEISAVKEEMRLRHENDRRVPSP